MLSYAIPILTTLLSLTSAASLQSRQSVACNNSPDLCSKSYSAITQLGTHNSPFVRDSSTGYSTSGNQYYNSTIQLGAGVRTMSGQVHHNNGDWHMCHTSCDLLDAGLLSDWLKEIKTWMDKNPNDVVTLILVNSDNAAASDLHAEFQTAQITDLAYKPPSTSAPPASWPTLQTLISAGTRLMVFVASLDVSQISADQSYLMDEFTFMFENPYENTQPSDFTCNPDRPSGVKNNIQGAISSGRMAFMNHFLYETGALDIQTPDVENITTTNNPSSSAVGMLGTALSTCSQAYGRAPSIVLVDFFDEGPSINAIDAVNGITPTGRITLPARDKSIDRADSSFAGINTLVEQVRSGEKPSKGAWIYGSGKWSFGGINLSGGNIVE